MPNPPTASDTPPSSPVFGLRLSDVRVQDFRALRDVVLRLEPGTTVLVGENNSGKTSFLEALAIALGDRRPRLEDLFCDPNGRATELQVDLRFAPTTGDEFPDGVRDVVGNAIQLTGPAEYFVVRVVGSVSDDGLDVALKRFFLRGWASDRAGAAELAILKDPAVGRDALALFRFDMLDARRDIVEQLRNRRTHWGRTTTTIDVTPALRKSIETSLRELGEQVTSGSSVLARMKVDLAQLSEALSQGSLNVEIEALPRSLDDLIRAMDIVVAAPSSSAFPIGVQGMGTRSLAALLVFRSFVNVVRARLNADRLLSLAAFEEPEAHLHPHAQRAVFQLLGQIHGQRVISTHSAHIAEIADVRSFRVFRRKGPSTVVASTASDVETAWATDLPLVQRFVQTQNPEIFFARAVGIVEGQTEATAFPEFARAWWPPRGADAVGCSLVYTEGAGAAKHIVRLLEALAIPWIIFSDGDPAGDQGLAGVSKVIGRVISRASPEVVQLPAGQSFESYILGQGYRKEIEAAASSHSAGPLDVYREQKHGQKERGGALRDYQSMGWEDRLALDFLLANKGTIGRPLASSICERTPGGKAVLPQAVVDFFDRLDALVTGKS